MAVSVGMVLMTRMYLEQHGVTASNPDHPVFQALADALDLSPQEFKEVVQKFETSWRNLVLDTLDYYYYGPEQIPEWAAQLDEKKATIH